MGTRACLPDMMCPNLWPSLFFPVFFSLVFAQGPVQTLFPAAIPLAVKTPYLNTWYASLNNSAPLSNSWPQFWTLTVSPFFYHEAEQSLSWGVKAIMGWAGRIRVDGTTYQWMGHDASGVSGNANVTNIQITPTRSIFVMQAGPMNMTITFLSPVEVGHSVLVDDVVSRSH